MTATSQTSAGRVAAGSGRGSPDLESARPAEHHCTCAHSAVLHNLSGKGARTDCSFIGPRGVPCDCRRYIEGDGDDG